jgi:hypothetical protein
MKICYNNEYLNQYPLHGESEYTMTTSNTTQEAVDILLPAKHRVTKISWTIDGKKYTFITARDDNRDKDDLIARQKVTGKLNGVYGMIAKYPNDIDIEDIHLNLPKEVAESYRSWEIRKDKLMGHESLNSRENY